MLVEFYFLTVEKMDVETGVKEIKNMVLDKNPVQWLSDTKKNYKYVNFIILFYKEIDEKTYYDCKGIIGS